jgi:hypothetical protein
MIFLESVIRRANDDSFGFAVYKDQGAVIASEPAADIRTRNRTVVARWKRDGDRIGADQHVEASMSLIFDSDRAKRNDPRRLVFDISRQSLLQRLSGARPARWSSGGEIRSAR